MKKCIMTIMAHADDVEFCAGGTLAKYIHDGYKGVYGLLSNCSSGYHVTKKGPTYSYSEKISPLRIKEATNAAKVFGVEMIRFTYKESCYTLKSGKRIWLDFKDYDYEGERLPSGDMPLVSACQSDRCIDTLAKKIIKYEPEIVIGQNIDDNNPDHFAACLLVYKAFKKASQKVKLGSFYVPVKITLAPSFYQIEPDFIVDVTDYIDIVFKAVKEHKCQTQFAPRENGMIKPALFIPISKK